MTDRRNSSSDTPAIDLALPGGGHARIAQETTSGIGRFVRQFFSRSEARHKIDTAMAERIVSKVENGDMSFNDTERFFLGRIYRRDLRRYINSERVIERAEEVFPDVEKRMKQLPPARTAHTSAEWVARFERDTEDVSDDEVRDLYARILAGEAARGGTFSLKTLTLVRDLDRDVARDFQSIVRFVVDGRYLPIHPYPSMDETFSRLMEAGLIRVPPGVTDSLTVLLPNIASEPERLEVRLRYGDRLLIVRQTRAKQQVIALDAYTLAVPGQELATIPAFEFDEQYFRSLAGKLRHSLGRQDSEVKWAKLGPEGGEEFDFDPPLSVA